MLLFPKAKINIGLYITERRPDGFHNLQTIFYPVGLCDALEFVVPEERPEKDILICTGISLDSAPGDNIVLKALRIMRKRCDIPFLRIHLHKVIPSGAGLGGGSSDAAALIKGLNRYFEPGLSVKELLETALETGSDCPFFIEGVPAYAEGRGEIQTPVAPLENSWHLILVKPPVNVSTSEAYKNCIPRMREQDLSYNFRSGVEKWKGRIENDFEDYVFQKHPEIAEVKAMLYASGAVYSSMSGSGSAVYGIFGRKPDIPGSISPWVIYSGAL